MSPFAAFLVTVLREGRAVFRGPSHRLGSDGEASALLQQAFGDYRLRVAGPAIAFDSAAALHGARLVYHACWFLLSRDEPEAELERSLTSAAVPRSAAEHLSADLVLRFLPHIYRRAHAHDPADRLTILLAEVLRRWPLSGVLSDVADGPLTPLDFDGHPGLWMLYAERLARHEKPAWMPTGPGLDYVELVYHELGMDSARLLQLAEPVKVATAAGEEGEADE